MLSDRVDSVLPAGSTFLRLYAEYASQCCDAPDLYHLGVGLTIFSGAIAKSVSIPFLAGRTLIPNLYTLLVGPSRSARKTASMDAGVGILQAANPEAIISVPGSYEELITQLRATPSGILTFREFGHFLKTTQRGYSEPMRTVLMDIYDWPSNRPYTRNLRKGKTIIEPPICLSLLGAVSTDLLYAFTDTEEWTGGFMARMLLLYGERGEFRMPLPWPQAESYLANILQQWLSASIPPCGGFTPDAWNLFGQWSQFRDSLTHTAPSRVSTHISGATTLVAKVALLMAVDRGEPHGGPGWLISLDTVNYAIKFVDGLYLPSVFQLGEKLTIGPWERDRQRVLDCVDRAGPHGIAQHDLLRRVKISSTYLKEILDTLREERTLIQTTSDSRGPVIKRPPSAGVVPFTPSAPQGNSFDKDKDKDGDK